MNLQTLALYVILPILSIAILLVFLRIVRGPEITDRIIALDLLGTLGIAVAGTYAIAADQEAFLDIAIIIGLISFLATIAFAQYLERRL